MVQLETGLRLITDMSGAFMNRIFNEDLSGWNVSNVTFMKNMFSII